MKLMKTRAGWIGGATIGGASALAGGLSASLIGGVRVPPGAAGVALAAGAALGAGLWVLSARTRMREVRRLAEMFADAGEERVDPGAGPAWLAPLAQGVSEARSRFLERLQSAENRLREIEIRRRITESERRQVESTLHSLRDAVLVTDTFDELKMANEAAATLLGFDLQQAVHKPIDEVLTDKSLIRVISEARAAAENNERRHVEYTMTARGPDGRSELRAFDITLAPMTNPSGEGGASGVVTILRDVTREKEIAQMKSDFVSQVSHELRTPLSSINAYVEMLLDGEAADEKNRQEFYEIIKNEADRLTRLIDNMLNISRIEAGIVQVEDTEVDFVEVAREVVEIMQPQAKLKNITLLMKAGPMVYTAQASRDMMHQVVLNLVSNAVKYTPEGGRVTVSVENDDTTRSVMIGVQDTGLGIPPEAVDKVFEKFYRIDSYKRVAKGTGLGLNLVKNIVETLHSGQVGLSSQVGLGSRFWFTIPYERKGRAATRAAA